MQTLSIFLGVGAIVVSFLLFGNPTEFDSARVLTAAESRSTVGSTRISVLQDSDGGGAGAGTLFKKCKKQGGRCDVKYGIPCVYRNGIPVLTVCAMCELDPEVTVCVDETFSVCNNGGVAGFDCGGRDLGQCFPLGAGCFSLGGPLGVQCDLGGTNKAYNECLIY